MQSSFATQSNVAVVANSSHFEILHRIEAALFTHPYPRPKLIRIESNNFQNYLRSERSAQLSLIVAVGTAATKVVLEQNQSTPVLIILLRQYVLQDILKSTNRSFDDPKHPVSAIYLDQPFNRQVDLIRFLYPTPDFQGPVAVLLGPDSMNFQDELLQEGAEHNLAMDFAFVDGDENPVPIMNHFLENNKVFLSVPDSTIYNPKTARGILLTAYRKRVPVIGFSRALVQNGALAAVFSNDKQVANQVANTIMDITQNSGKPFPKPQFPTEFTISINFQVARSLGLTVPTEDELQSEMDMKDKTHKEGSKLVR